MLKMLAFSLFTACSLFAAGIDGNGFIRNWLILGPYGQTGHNNPGQAAQAQDYLTDGDLTQDTIAPFAGMIVDTNYNIAASTGLLPESNGQINSSGLPEWYEYNSGSSTIDYATVYAADVDNAMAYACCFVKNLTGNTLQNVHFACGSDDGIVVMLDDEIIWNNSVARGAGGDTEIQDRSGDFDLPPGMSRIMVKVFEGAGGWAFRCRLEDSNDSPILSDEIDITLMPYGPCPDSVAVFGDDWLREVTISWPHHYSSVEIWEGGVRLVQIDDPTQSFVVLSDVSLGQHTYEFRSEIGDDEPSCAPVECFVELIPLWPTGFQGTEVDTGVIQLEWHNLEPYYDVLKIQENNADLVGLVYNSQESVQISGLSTGVHTFTLIAELAGYESAGITCQVEVTGPPPIFKRGDANIDGKVDLADAISILEYLFQDGDASPCMDTTDVNDDGNIDLSDPVAALLYLFSNEDIPAPGADNCDLDPTADIYTSCQYEAGMCD